MTFYDLLCVAACIAMALELEWQISQISPKKKLQIGSFRIDPQGNQKLKSVGGGTRAGWETGGRVGNWRWGG